MNFSSHICYCLSSTLNCEDHSTSFLLLLIIIIVIIITIFIVTLDS